MIRRACLVNWRDGIWRFHWRNCGIESPKIPSITIVIVGMRGGSKIGFSTGAEIRRNFEGN